MSISGLDAESLFENYVPVRVPRILIYHRKNLKLRNDALSFPLNLNESGSLEDIDEVSGEALCHITQLCRDVICETRRCTTGCPTMKFSCGACRMRYYTQFSNYILSNVCGSFAEGCMLPIFYVQNDKTGAMKIWSDIDYMVQHELKIGFEGTEADIFASIETENTPPGYLQLREIGTGKLHSVPGRIKKLDSLGPNKKYSVFRSLVQDISFSPLGPATEVTHSYQKPHASINSFDAVTYYSCSSWPPIAKPWIDRERPCNWPSKETIQTIVSKGCRIVHTPHVLCQGQETVFRFSFSEAETILFRTITSDRKKCFVVFKSLTKYCNYKVENKKYANNLSTYCLKTIFLWACETIPADHWQTTNGWSMCLLYMIDQLYSCVKFGKLSGYFIPETNLINNLKRPCELLVEIKKLRNNPISYAATFIDATKCFRGF